MSLWHYLFIEKSIWVKQEGDYFLSNSTNYINSKRDFSIGQYHRLDVDQKVIPRMNIEFDEAALFSMSSGIYTLGYDWHNNPHQYINEPWWNRIANYSLKGNKSKRNVFYSLYRGDSLIYSSWSVLKINGNRTRSFPQKSFRLQDNSVIQSNIFKESKSDWIIFRNSGNDWDRTMFSDSYISQIASEIGLISSKSEPVNVYFNNVFWGLYNLRQRIDENFISQTFSVPLDSVEIAENNGVVKYGGEKTEKNITTLKSILSSSGENKFEQIEALIDIDNFMTYIMFETYFNNTDWPQNNVLMYKTTGIKSKWNFIPKDMDFSLAYTGELSYKNNAFEHLFTQKSIVSDLFKLLINDEKHKDLFKLKVHSVLKNELNTSNLKKLYSKYEAQYSSIIEPQIFRWRYPKTLRKWKEYSENNKHFIQNRTEYYIEFINKL